LLGELAEKGLIEKIIAKPAKYRAIPLADGLKELLRRRQEETDKLQKEAEWISKAAEAFPVVNEEDGEFRVLPNREPIIRMSREFFLTAKSSVDLMNEAQEILRLHELHVEPKKIALKNGVQIRELVGKSASEVDLPPALLNLAKTNPLFILRMLDAPSTVRLMIKDSKEIFFATTCKPNIFSQPFFWTNNPILVQIVQQWYNGVWESANACPE
jgi:sugar-specific transcriptional regulator TrmB